VGGPIGAFFGLVVGFTIGGSRGNRRARIAEVEEILEETDRRIAELERLVGEQDVSSGCPDRTQASSTEAARTAGFEPGRALVLQCLHNITYQKAFRYVPPYWS
jgi:hypothetical protein